MSSKPSSGGDDKLFSRSEYRRVIAWPERIEREAPFLKRVGTTAPAKELLDVGCGTGEHARFFAESGWRAVGIDLSEDMIADARSIEGETDAGGHVRFEERAAADAGRCPEAPFGAAIFLGNGLAFIPDEAALRTELGGVCRALRSGAPFLLQLLNYERIATGEMRAMPINFRPHPEGDEGDEIVFMRLMRKAAGRAVSFVPVTLTLNPENDPPVRLEKSKVHTHHAWRLEELTRELAALDCPVEEVFGGMREESFDPAASQDLVILARKR